LIAAAKEYTLLSSTEKAYWMELISTTIMRLKAPRPSLPFLADIEQSKNKAGDHEKERTRFLSYPNHFSVVVLLTLSAQPQGD